MKIRSQQLIDDLVEMTRRHLRQAIEFKQREPEDLAQKPGPGKWSALECLEHLNLYGDFYLPEIRRRIENAGKPTDPDFISGWLGNYFAKSMLPGEKMMKMKTFRDKDPQGKRVDISSIDRFMDQQRQLLELLESARAVSLGGIRVSISITRWVRLKLGDTLRFVIYHNHRHMTQASRTLTAIAQKQVKQNVHP